MTAIGGAPARGLERTSLKGTTAALRGVSIRSIQSGCLSLRTSLPSTTLIARSCHDAPSGSGAALPTQVGKA